MTVCDGWVGSLFLHMCFRCCPTFGFRSQSNGKDELVILGCWLAQVYLRRKRRFGHCRAALGIVIPRK